jgi:DNA polymerase V
MQLTEFIPLRPHSETFSLLANAAVPAGEACELSTEFEEIDFNEYLTKGNPDVYLVRVNGDSMEAEIYHGDLLIVNRNLQASNGDKVIASVNGSLTVKVFSTSKNGLQLVASNGKYPPRKITAKDDYKIFGVVTHVLHSLKKI